MPIEDATRSWIDQGNPTPGDPATAEAQKVRLQALEELGTAYLAGGPSSARVTTSGAGARITALEEWADRVIP